MKLTFLKLQLKNKTFDQNQKPKSIMSDSDRDDLQFDIGDQQQEFRDHDDNDDGEEYDEDEENEGGQHMGYYREDNKEYDLDMSFEKDLDRLTKVKAQLMFNLNKERQLEGIPLIYEDISLASIAQQYAQSLKTSSSDEAYLKRLCDQVRNDVDFRTCELISNYEEDVQVTGSYTQKYFIETSYLFLQMDKEREILMDPNNTHVGIGIAGNQSTIAIVMLVAQRELTILQMEQTGENLVQLRGKMLDYTTGICGVKIYNAQFKEIYAVLYDKIDFDRTTREFCVYLEFDLNWKERRWVQLHIRQSPDSIAYRKPRKEKDKDRNYFKHLKMRLRSLFIPYPDKRYINYFNELVEAEQDQNSKLSNMILESLHNEKNKGQQEISENKDEDDENQEDSQNEDEEDNQDEQQKEAQDARLKEQMSSNKEIKEELQMAINEAKNTYDSLIDTNRMFQGKIKELRQKNHILLDKTGEASMNEHKYLNILAQVHQTRVELQQTQDRYNRMSLELQNKLNEKQSKCNQIRSAFQDLKRQVARKATYSRSDQPIKAHKIEEWEERQAKITEELQNLRLEILRARNTLDKNQKILKKKEELAEGLHLIDFEQLKIENQTLNEKIEQRNEDLHKLKKKTTTMVQILTHTREKLVFVQKNRDSLLVTSNKLDTEIQKMRSQINGTKDSCEKLRLQIQDAKQQTEIVNSQQLVVDFKRRAQNIKKLEKDINEMLEKEKQMKTVIEMYQRKIKKEAIGR